MILWHFGMLNLEAPLMYRDFCWASWRLSLLKKKHFSKAGKDMIYVFFLQRFDPWWFSVFVFGKKDTSINKKEISGKDKNIKGQIGLQ